MAASDLELTAGTTFGFAVTWQQKSGETLAPIDITGCTARFQVRDAKTDELLIDAQTEGRGIEIPAGADGLIKVSLGPEVTRGLSPRAIGQAVYELRVYFPSGDAYPVLPAGFLVIKRGVIRD
jgi:hypothetical protein